MFRPEIYDQLRIRTTNYQELVHNYGTLTAAIREALHFKASVTELKSLISRLTDEISVENKADAMLMLEKLIALKFENLRSSHWRTIADELTIVEHKGLSTFQLKWKEDFSLSLEKLGSLIESLDDDYDLAQLHEFILETEDRLLALQLTIEAELLKVVNTLDPLLLTNIKENNLSKL
jgi:hypothetical protein